MSDFADIGLLYAKRDEKGIYVRTADGEKVRLDDFEAQLIARSWFDAVGGRMADLSNRTS